MPGQRGETTGVNRLMADISCGAFLGDKAYDADWLRGMLVARGIEPVIPARKGRNAPAPHDAEKYKWRHLIENYFQKLRECPKLCVWGLAHSVFTGHRLNRSGYRIANWFRAATHSLTHRPVFSNLRIAK